MINKTESKKIKVLVVDDHTLFSEGTVSLLRVEPSILAVGIVKNGMECMRFINKTEVDVVMLDINLPDICGVNIIEKMKMVQPAMKILMLTGQDPKGYVTESIKKGANGFLLKNCSVEDMIDAIFKVFNKGAYFSQGLDLLINNNGDNNSKNPEVLEKILTVKELEILELISKGFHNKEIAELLGIKVRTVEFHVSNILPKLGVRKRFEAVLKWADVSKEKKS
ncbi:response regulator transcription factor [Candidatus Desulfosporosinus nitrosoreducens]|uniref:response regulator transcription factor n=1 Tax=Candidatus Desulfosporosinus nitrosoreducens TaxID=3401928 RepID=UPI00280A5B44|nr:response regulator transcription factor [Desulfosporosinus sp. PR]